MTNVKRCQVRSCGNIWEILLFIRGFPHSSVGKESACNSGDLVSIPGLGKSPGEGKGYPLQYSGLENPMDCIVHGLQRASLRVLGFYFLGFWTDCVGSSDVKMQVFVV